MFFNTATAFVELERELNLISGDLFSKLLTVELPGINMKEQWDNSAVWVQAVSIILALDGVFLSWLGLSTLLSPDDWRRR